MTECRKVIYNRKIFFAIGILFLAQLIFPIMAEKQATQRWEEQKSQSYVEYLKEQEQMYADHFSERVENVIQQADFYASISIFSQDGSFPQKNAQKTKSDYQNLSSLQIEAQPVHTITKFFNNTFENLCAVIAAVLAAFAVVGTGNPKISCTTYPTRFGRLRLSLEQGTALVCWALLLSFSFGVGVLVKEFGAYHENAGIVLASPAQSFFCFSDFPWQMSLWEALFLYLLFRALVLCAVMFFVWTATLACGHIVLTTLTIELFGAVEYLFYALIDDANVWCLLKYYSLAFPLLENDAFLKYKNLNIAGCAVDRAAVVTAFLLLFCVFNGTAAVFLHCRHYPYRSNGRRFLAWADRLAERFQIRRAHFLAECSMRWLEVYRIFFPGKGILAVLIFVVLIAWRADFTQLQRSASQAMYYAFMNEYTGEPDSESEAALESIEVELEQIDTAYAEKTSAKELSAEESLKLSLWYESYEQTRVFAKKVRSETNALAQIKKNQGINVWYVNQYSYRHLLECDDAILNIALFLVLFWLCAAAYIGERIAGMVSLVNSSLCCESLYRTRRRIILSFISCLYALVLCYEIFMVAAVNGLTGGSAPVQSILQLADFPIRCTIWQYFTARFGGKYCLLIVISSLFCRIYERVLCMKRSLNGTAPHKRFGKVKLWS